MHTHTHAVRVPFARQLARVAALLVVSLFVVTCGKDGVSPPPGATQLAFKVDPVNATAAAAIAPAIVVEARDANGDPVTDFTGSVTISIGTNPGGGALSGTATQTAVAGIATFADLSINRSGTGYRLQATTSGLTNATSATFNISAGPAAQISFNTQPSNAVAGANITPAVKVEVEDAIGNLVDTFNGSVSVAISSGSGTAGAVLSGTTTATASAGIATFSNLNIDKVGTTYTLSATSTGLLDATSSVFDVLSGPVSDLIITVQPSNATAGVDIAPAVVVTGRDALGNVATAFNGLVSLTISAGTGDPGATLSGITSVSAVAGVATFNVLSIDKAGTGYTLAASATGATGATTAPFDIAVGAASELVFSVQPSTGIAGSPITPAIAVSVEDGSGNVVTTASNLVTVVLLANPGSAVLSGTLSATPVNGVVTFSDLSLDKAGTGYTLAVTATGLTGATSDAFNTLAGAGAILSFTVQPTTAVAGVGVLPAMEVTLKDSLGNIATGFNGNVTLTIANNAGGGTLSGTTTVQAVAGVALFSGISIDKVGTGYTVQAGVTGLTPVTSGAFDITPGAATQIVYSTQPSNATAGAQIAPAVVLTALDAMGNVATGYNGVVTVAITAGTGTAGATLSGAIAVAATNGVASFGTLNIDKSGTGYTLGAAASGLTGATSAAFDIAAGSATQLVYGVQPTDAVAGSAITPAVEIKALDALGNLATGFVGSVTVAITAGTGTAGAVLSGTATAAAVGGIASFSTLSIDKAGSGYTLGATAGGVSGATSTPFAIAVGSAVKLAFSVQPVNTTAGAAVTPGVEVTAQDGVGNTVASFTGAITVDIGNNPVGGVLAGTLTMNAVGGIATFSNLSIAKSGTGFTLTAAAATLVGATSNAFNIVAGTATQLSFTVQPATVAAGASITPAVEVTALDLLGNIATSFTGTVTMAIGTNPATGVLSGTLTDAASAGVASFNNLKIDKSGVGYTLSATATGVTAAVSGAFDVTVGTPTKLFFSVQPPASTTAGVAMTPSIQVVAQDAAGNPVPTYAGTVTVAITSGTGTSGALLRGTTVVGAAGGVATFSTLNIDKTGTGYTLRATATGLTAATSTALAITAGPVVKLGFTVQPVATKSGSSISPSVKIAGQDSLGNTVTSFVNNIIVAIGNNAGTPIPGTLTGTLTIKAVAGVSTFNNLKIDKVGTGYTLIASSGALIGATSAAFNITPGNATQLTFTVPPVSTAAGATIPQVKVTALDAALNVATGFTANITVAIGTNAGGIPGTLSGLLVVKAVAGVSNFSNLSIDQAGNGYTLTASASGLTGTTSPSFDITNGSKLEFTVQPSSVAQGAAIAPAVQVTAKDNLGAVLSGFTGNITIAISAGTGTAGAVLGGTKTVAAVAGVATFSDLNIDLSGTGYRLAATSTGLTTATSNAFQVTGGVVGPATKLGFTTQPSNTPAGTTIIPGVVVAVQDASGNTVTGISGTITIGFGSNPAGGILSGTTTVTINAGKGSFPNLSIDKTGTYTLVATSTGLTSATSAAFTITAAPTLHLVYTVQPANTTAGQLIPTVQVAAQNASNVTQTSFTGPVNIAITAGSGANGATLAGTTTVNAVNGVASFSNLSITKAGTGFKFSASSAGLGGATSASFVINADVAVLLHFSQQPTTTTANAAITPAVTVDVRDQYNNVVKTFASNITVAIAAGTGAPGAVLSGTKTIMPIQGVATFSNLSINLLGSGNTAYRLSTTASGVTSATSNAFSIN